jgi:hypothetical protein
MLRLGRVATGSADEERAKCRSLGKSPRSKKSWDEGRARRQAQVRRLAAAAFLGYCHCANNKRTRERRAWPTFRSKRGPRAGLREAISTIMSSKDHADHELGTFKTQHEAIAWAKSKGHAPLVARVRHLNDKKKPDHWRAARGDK